MWDTRFQRTASALFSWQLYLALNHTAFLSALHFLGTCQAINNPSPVVELGFWARIGWQSVCLARDIHWLQWSLQKCWCELFGRQWGENGHTVQFTPSSRYSFSGVRHPFNHVLSDGCFRNLCSFEMSHDCCKSWSLKGKLLLRLSVMHVTARKRCLSLDRISHEPRREWMVCVIAMASLHHFPSLKSLEQLENCVLERKCSWTIIKTILES